MSFLKILINDFSPQVLCLQETNFKGNSCAQLRGYKSVFCNRRDALIASGGVATFVKQDVFRHNIPLQTSLEATAVSIKLNIVVTVCNIYLPNSQTLNILELDNIITQLPKPFIVVGDFNSHNIM